MAQTRVLFCTCDSGVARCKSQHQCHFWRMYQLFVGSCQSNVCIHDTMDGLPISKDSLKACGTCRVWYLIVMFVMIPDLCTLTYFALKM